MMCLNDYHHGSSKSPSSSAPNSLDLHYHSVPFEPCAVLVLDSITCTWYFFHLQSSQISIYICCGPSRQSPVLESQAC
jgi:hypothetical protein